MTDGTRAASPEAASQATAAYQTIKRAIIQCQLAPGQQISESHLAERFGLHRAAIRSALQRLRQEQFVRAIARRGHVVASISFQDIRDIFEVRRYLEPPTVRRAAQAPADAEHLRALEEACRTARYRPGDPEGLDRFLRANTALHVGIAASSGNQRLADLLDAVLQEMERLFHFALQLTDRNDEMHHEHHDLMEALLAGDADLAHALALDQIISSERMVLGALLTSPHVTLSFPPGRTAGRRA